MRILFLAILSLFLIHCGPVETLEERPSTKVQDLVVSNNSHAQISNKIELENVDSPIYFVEFNYRSRFAQTLRIKRPDVEYDNGLKCALNYSFEWGIRKGKNEYDYVEVQNNDPLEVLPDEDHILRAKFVNLQNCGRVLLDFRVEPY